VVIALEQRTHRKKFFHRDPPFARIGILQWPASIVMHGIGIALFIDWIRAKASEQTGM
jgi:hypothetical protein